MKDIIPLLKRGEENAIKSRDLVSLLNTTTRDLRQCVERERNNGEIILSSNKGYFLLDVDETGKPTEKGMEELIRFHAVQRAKGIGCLKSATSARLAIRKYETQDGEANVKKTAEIR